LKYSKTRDLAVESEAYNNNLIKTINDINFFYSFFKFNQKISLISPLLGTLKDLPYRSIIRRTGIKPPRGPSAGWWVLTTANAAGT
jgi:hypothetical protein